MAQWETAEIYKELLRDLGEIDVDSVFGITTTTNLSKLFFVEVAFLNYWNKVHNEAPDQEGINLRLKWKENRFYVTISCDNNAVQPVKFFYNSSPKDHHRWGLDIIYKGNLVYSRSPDHDPTKEWAYNELTGKLVDEDDEPLFHGPRDPHTPDLPYGG